ncbi:MAG: DUF4292 domain-containing protein [Dysgonamonadaceae bacterium]|jgi:tetratricopeptide (TPR) repeat protein|nr:DUF4292 domain-containing protein [Dysgonamonadaceae bacterium]
MNKICTNTKAQKHKSTNTLCILCVWCFCIFAFTSAFADSTSQTGRKFDYFFMEAMGSKEVEEYSDAFNALRYALHIDSTSAAAWAELSNFYMYLQLDSLAVDAVQKAARLAPDNLYYKILLAETNGETDNLPEAIAQCEEIIEAHTEQWDLQFYLSELYFRSGQINRAITVLNDLEESEGMSEGTSMQKHQLYLSMGKQDEAVNEITRLIARYPSTVKYRIFIGDFYMERNEPEKALEYYEQARKINFEDPFYALAMSLYYERMGNYEAATDEIEKTFKNTLLDRETQIAMLKEYVQKFLLNRRHVKSADVLFQTLMDKHSEEKELNMLYGQFLAAQEQWEEAQAQFQIVTEDDPENIDAWLQLLNIAKRRNNSDEIIRLCKASQAHLPEVPDFYFYKSSALYQKKQFKEALLNMERGMEYVPDKNRTLLSTFYGRLGDLYYETGEKQKTYHAYEKALQYNANNFLVLNNYAYFLSLDTMQLDKAESMIDKCMKAYPENPTYVDTYAWILFCKGNYSLAKYHIEHAIANGGAENPDMLGHYGDILFGTGDIDKAVQQWEKALEIKEKNGETDTAVIRRKIENARENGMHIVFAMLSRSIAYKTISANLRFGVKLGANRKSITTDAQLRIVKDDMIQLSLRIPIVGTEAARINISPEQILIIDRINKVYFTETTDSLKKYFPFGFDFYAIRSLLTNQLFIAGKREVAPEDYAAFDCRKEEFSVSFSRQDGRGTVYGFMSDTIHRILKTEIYNIDKMADIHWDYADFKQMSDNSLFPMKMNMTLTLPENEITMDLKFSAVHIDDAFELKTDIPSKYKPIDINQIINLIRSFQ